MEPRRDDGDDAEDALLTVGDEGAAMEPRRDDGDDRPAPMAERARPDAAMEPRRDDGDDRKYLTPPRQTVSPQWSPVVTTGTTRSRAEHDRRGIRAAMEPRRDDGDDLRDGHTCTLLKGSRNGAPS